MMAECVIDIFKSIKIKVQQPIMLATSLCLRDVAGAQFVEHSAVRKSCQMVVRSQIKSTAFFVLQLKDEFALTKIGGLQCREKLLLTPYDAGDPKSRAQDDYCEHPQDHQKAGTIDRIFRLQFFH